MRKKNNYLLLLSFIFAYLSITMSSLHARSLVMGIIQFPRLLKKAPSIRIYYGGKIINSHAHEDTPKVTFEVSKNNRQTIFYLLVTEYIQYQVKKCNNSTWASNTIDYLQLPKEQAYKFYRLELLPDTLEPIDPFPKQAQAEKNKTYHWQVKEEQLPTTGKIPDETIVACYFPEAIVITNGGNKLELPPITIKRNILEQMGSEEKLHEESIKLQIASLDTDTIHAPTKQEIKQGQQRTLIINHLT
ncbi:MAG: hypothetical protein WCD44_02480 [Candidatus Babeliales bacterium]